MAGQIEGKSFTLRQLFEDAVYTIDYYQREYAWSEKDVRTLVRDLWDEFSPWWSSHRRPRRSPEPPAYFLGPFVYYEAEKGVRFLVDGQQRFTTIHLIFIHLRAALQDMRERKAAELLDRVIRSSYSHGRDRFKIDIDERQPALSAYYDRRKFEPPSNASLSVRTLHARSQDIDELLNAHVNTEALPDFANWLLSHVVLVGILAPSRDNGFRIFETMNDRGAGLTSVDLLKSFLLSNVRRDVEELNRRWRDMLAELTAVDRQDRAAPERFLKAVLIARHADMGDGWQQDVDEIDRAPNIWVASNVARLELAGDRQFFRFVEELLILAKPYRTFLAASHQLDQYNDLQAIYFNEVTGLTNQMVAILAAVRPNDTASLAKQKASKIAGYLDRWYVRRVFGDLPVERRDFNDVMHTLVQQLRTGDTVDDVAQMLGKAATDDGEEPFAEEPAFATYGMRGNNINQIRYILARITAYVAVGCGNPNEIESYLSSERNWEIEHLWPNRHDLYRNEVPDEIIFRALRNRLGLLGLLRARDNASLGGLPFHEKMKRYTRHNDLLAILSPDYGKNNPTLRDFIRENDIASHFRSFGPTDTIEKVAKVRQELYLRLCDRIWDLTAIGVKPRTAGGRSNDGRSAHSSAGTQPKVVAKRSKATPPLRTDVARMVRASVLTPGQKIVARHRGKDYWATVEPTGMIVLASTGERFSDVHEAGRGIKGTKRCEGMKLWEVTMPEGRRVSLSDLREAAHVDGRL